MEELAELSSLPTDVVSELRSQVLSVVSFEKPIGLEKDGRLADLIADERAESPQERTIGAKMAEALEHAIDVLTPKEQTVIRMRYGVGGHRDHTLAQIGRHLHVTRERVRQIEVAALAKLRKAAGSDRLRTFLED